jgi:hypothetical protein
MSDIFGNEQNVSDIDGGGGNSGGGSGPSSYDTAQDTRMTAIESSIASSTINLNPITSRLDALETDVGILETTSSSHGTRLTLAENEIDVLQTAVNTLNTFKNTTETIDNQQNTQLTSLQNQINSITGVSGSFVSQIDFDAYSSYNNDLVATKASIPFVNTINNDLQNAKSTIAANQVVNSQLIANLETDKLSLFDYTTDKLNQNDIIATKLPTSTFTSFTATQTTVDTQQNTLLAGLRTDLNALSLSGGEVSNVVFNDSQAAQDIQINNRLRTSDFLVEKSNLQLEIADRVLSSDFTLNNIIVQLELDTINATLANKVSNGTLVTAVGDLNNVIITKLSTATFNTYTAAIATEQDTQDTNINNLQINVNNLINTQNTINTAFSSKLDTAVFNTYTANQNTINTNMQTQLNSFGSDILTISGQADNNATNITTLTTNLSAVSTRVATLENRNYPQTATETPYTTIPGISGFLTVQSALANLQSNINAIQVSSSGFSAPITQFINNMGTSFNGNGLIYNLLGGAGANNLQSRAWFLLSRLDQDLSSTRITPIAFNRLSLTSANTGLSDFNTAKIINVIGNSTGNSDSSIFAVYKNGNIRCDDKFTIGGATEEQYTLSRDALRVKSSSQLQIIGSSNFINFGQLCAVLTNSRLDQIDTLTFPSLTSNGLVLIRGNNLQINSDGDTESRVNLKKDGSMQLFGDQRNVSNDPSFQVTRNGDTFLRDLVTTGDITIPTAKRLNAPDLTVYNDILLAGRSILDRIDETRYAYRDFERILLTGRFTIVDAYNGLSDIILNTGTLGLHKSNNSADTNPYGYLQAPFGGLIPVVVGAIPTVSVSYNTTVRDLNGSIILGQFNEITRSTSAPPFIAPNIAIGQGIHMKNLRDSPCIGIGTKLNFTNNTPLEQSTGYRIAVGFNNRVSGTNTFIFGSDNDIQNADGNGNGTAAEDQFVFGRNWTTQYTSGTSTNTQSNSIYLGNATSNESVKCTFGGSGFTLLDPSAGGLPLGLQTTRGANNPKNTLYIAVSSRKFKKNITNIDVNLHDFMKLRPVNYIYNYGNDETAIVRHGLIAEEVEENPSFAHMCVYSENDNKEKELLSLDYPSIIAQLINVNQQLLKRIDNLERRFASIN